MPGKSFFLYPWYYFLLPVFFVFHGFVANYFLIPVKDTLILLLTYLGVSIILAGLLWLYFRDIKKAIFFSFLLLAFNFFFGYLHDSLKFFFPDSIAIKYSVVLSFAFLIFLSLAIILKKKKSIS